MSKPVKKILSIDGGGIRGIIPAMVLAELERRTETPISQLFDLISGSSTGGLLSLIAALPGENGEPRYAAADYPELYTQYSRQIFTRTRWDAILSMDNWRVRRYPDTGIKETLKNVFGDAEIRDALTDILITSYDIERRQPWFFRSSRAKHGERCNFLMRDVVRATTAAPTFFEPAKVENSDDPDNPFVLIDGSMTSINPALCAYVEARGMYPDADDFIVVSLGTGNLTQPLPYGEVKNWGLMDWARPLSDIMFDASSRTVDYQMQKLLPRFEDGTNRYFRLQKRIEGMDHRMDDVSEVSLSLIKQWGEELIEDNDATLDVICELLISQDESIEEVENRTRRGLFSLSSLAFWRQDDNKDDEEDTAEDDETEDTDETLEVSTG